MASLPIISKALKELVMVTLDYEKAVWWWGVLLMSMDVHAGCEHTCKPMKFIKFLRSAAAIPLEVP